MKAVFDTNILIDYFSGNVQASIELDKFDKKMISYINYIECLTGVSEQDTIKIIRDFLKDNFEIISITEEIADEAIQIRRNKALKLPDAIILATAKVNEALLVTRDRGFDCESPIIRIPY